MSTKRNRSSTCFAVSPNVTFKHVTHPNAQALFQPTAARQYDVLVLYDMWEKIDDATKENFKALLNNGKGLVVLHHAIANYNDWDDYAKIIGAKYYLNPMTVDGVNKPRSLWKHGVDIKVHIVDPNHPVTRGLKDFEIHDETYNLFERLSRRDAAADRHRTHERQDDWLG